MESVRSLTVDRLLETRHAAEVILTLENALARGLNHVVFELHPSETSLHPSDLQFYDNEEEATDDWELKTTGGFLPGDADHPIYCRETEQLLNQVRLANQELPEHLIAGTLFRYDARSDIFIEKGDPTNRIEMGKIWEDQLWSQFFFDHQTKNVYQGGFPNGERPVHVQLVLLPTIPYCEKLGIPVKSHQEKQVAEAPEKKQVNQNQKMQRVKNKNGRKL